MKNIKENIYKITKENNIKAFDVIVDKGNNFNLSVDDGKLKKYEVSGSEIVGIRVIKDSRVGISYSEATDYDSLEFMTKQALSNSVVAKLDAHQKISVKHDKPVIGNNDLTYIPDSTDADAKIELALKLESGLKEKDPSTKSPYNGFFESDAESIVFNSEGTECMQKNKIFACYTYALLDRDGEKSDHFQGSYSRTFKGLDLNSCIENSYNHAELLLKGKPISTGKYDIIFSIDQLCDLFGVFSRVFSAKAAIEKINPWKDKLNEPVAHDSLTLIDSPRYNGAMSYSTFDSEGALNNDLTLIEKGVLKNFYHNTSTSNYYKTKNNARAARSAKSNLSVSGNNLIIAKGTENVRKSKYVELIQLKGLHSGADAISGDFSFGASGYLYDGETLIQPVKGITISGNFYKMIKELQLGNNLQSDWKKCFFAPDIRFFDLSIAGN